MLAFALQDPKGLKFQINTERHRYLYSLTDTGSQGQLAVKAKGSP